jgi:hypothetical protein
MRDVLKEKVWNFCKILHKKLKFYVNKYKYFSFFKGLHFELVFELSGDNHTDEIRRPTAAEMQSSPLTQIAKYVATNSEVSIANLQLIVKKKKLTIN